MNCRATVTQSKIRRPCWRITPRKNGFGNILHFTDDGISGTRFDRPGYLAMMDEVEAGNVSVLLIKDMSRLGRDYLRVGLCMETLMEKGVRLIALNDGVDTARGDDDFTPFRNIIAEWYARDTSRKIKSVMQAKGNEGKRLTNFPIYGYRLHPDDKSKRRTRTPEDEWRIFENTHPAVVDEETWSLAQKCRETKRRPSPKLMGEANPLTGLLFCTDCDAKLYNHREEKSGKMYYHAKVGKYYPRSARDVYYCSSYCNDAASLRKSCTQHFIRTAAVRELLLDTIQKVSRFVRTNEAEFIRQVREASELRQEAAAKAQRRQLAKNQKRHTELDTVISKLFEQNATGKIPDVRFETLLAGYEKEQAALAQSIQALQAELDNFDADSVRADKFIPIVKKFTDFSELTTPMIHEFVEKIVVHEADKSSGERVQQVDIYLNFIGSFEIPFSEPTAEEIAEAEKLRIRREKKRGVYQRYALKRQREMSASSGV